MLQIIALLVALFFKNAVFSGLPGQEQNEYGFLGTTYQLNLHFPRVLSSIFDAIIDDADEEGIWRLTGNIVKAKQCFEFIKNHGSPKTCGVHELAIIVKGFLKDRIQVIDVELFHSLINHYSDEILIQKIESLELPRKIMLVSMIRIFKIIVSLSDKNKMTLTGFMKVGGNLLVDPKSISLNNEDYGFYGKHENFPLNSFPKEVLLTKLMRMSESFYSRLILRDILRPIARFLYVEDVQLIRCTRFSTDLGIGSLIETFGSGNTKNGRVALLVTDKRQYKKIIEELGGLKKDLASVHHRTDELLKYINSYHLKFASSDDTKNKLIDPLMMDININDLKIKESDLSDSSQDVPVESPSTHRHNQVKPLDQVEISDSKLMKTKKRFVRSSTDEFELSKIPGKPPSFDKSQEVIVPRVHGEEPANMPVVIHDSQTIVVPRLHSAKSVVRPSAIHDSGVYIPGISQNPSLPPPSRPSLKAVPTHPRSSSVRGAVSGSDSSKSSDMNSKISKSPQIYFPVLPPIIKPK